VAVDGAGNLLIAGGGVLKVDVNGVLTTVAGGGTNFPGDGGPATNVSIDAVAVSVGVSGNLFIADAGNNRIRRVDINGSITTVAGNGHVNLTCGGGDYSGDGGAATNASLSYPTGVAVDASGDVFIADAGNHVIRKVDTNGIITTVAGHYDVTFLGCPADSPYSGDGGPATNASLSGPSGVAVDGSGNLLIADSGNQRIRNVDSLGIITTVAGNGSQGFSGDGGPATNASLSLGSYSGLAVDASGDIFIGDSFNNLIREIHSVGPPTFATSDEISAETSGAYEVIITSPYGSVTSAVATVTVMVPPVITMNPPRVAGNNLLLGFNLTKGSSPSFTLLQSLAITGPWTTNTNAVLTTNAQSGGYQFTLPVPVSTEFFQVQSP